MDMPAQIRSSYFQPGVVASCWDVLQMGMPGQMLFSAGGGGQLLGCFANGNAGSNALE